jgi:hypothetical protein
MKKLALGCLGVLLLMAITGAALGYYFVYRPAKSYVTSFAQLQEIPKLHEQVRNKARFTPPAAGELTPALLDRYLQAQDALHARLGARLEELDRKYKALDAGNATDPSFTEALGALRDLGDLLVDAKRAQVEVLNQYNFSLAEYEWVRRSAYAAAGLAFGGSLAEMIDSASRGQAPVLPAMDDRDTGLPEVPAANEQMVAPHVEKLRARVALAFFGL